jgi:hypothetical protein
MFDIFSIIGLVLVLGVLYSSSNRYYRLVKLERLEGNGISDEVYKAYDKRLRLECISFVGVVGAATIINKFVSILILAIAMFVLGSTLKVLIDKYFPIPK